MFAGTLEQNQRLNIAGFVGFYHSAAKIGMVYGGFNVSNELIEHFSQSCEISRAQIFHLL